MFLVDALRRTATEQLYRFESCPDYKQQTYMVEIILGALLIISLLIVTFTYWYNELYKKR